MNETISLALDDENELSFKVQVEGADNIPTKVRLVCEANDISYMFKGSSTGEVDVVKFTLPVMKNKLSEGTYSARIEVLIENKYFSPVQFDINFKQPVKVVAEALQVTPVVKKQEPKVTITQIIEKKQEPTVKPVVEIKKTLRDLYATKK